MANDEPRSRYLEVPGARLYHEVRGSGPLLVLTGVPMGTGGFAQIAPLLADAFTVVTHDPRGTFRSTVEDPSRETSVEVLADDLRRLLSSLGDGSAHVFGNSGGAVTGLALVARHPGLVRAFVAHEPPLPALLPDGERLRAAIGEVCDAYESEGRAAALKRYAAVTGIERFSQPPRARRAASHPEAFTPPTDTRAILDRFFRHLLRPVASYRPDLAALRASATRVVVAGGSTSRGQLAHRASVALAAGLGADVVDFPGGHTGFQEEPREFAQVLTRSLTAPV
ncbi:alpha/beta fold hydrolase [Actinomadura sp. NEAU-AAG7]|uniref:alpha/beta fold hydrolase n=1 Tax=Actinomadura sp. NEAU-AAG7 TaxID=2839640 RepID=UPI001BE3DFA1|nr:alpha/beta hydrolase [Actinomadura sp. NEAU-AAG7]MBT2211276.1 alpha/beta hydrolase [Actinomadura sp. NEAU-AAG7]